MQSVLNLMFTFIGPVHFVILKLHHHNNIHNNIDNNYNNTVSATHTQQESILPRLSNRSGIIYNNFVSRSPSNIHNSKGDSVQKKGLQRSFLPFMLVILGSPCLPFLLIHTPHSHSLKDNSSFGSFRLITVGHLPIKAE